MTLGSGDVGFLTPPAFTSHEVIMERITYTSTATTSSRCQRTEPGPSPAFLASPPSTELSASTVSTQMYLVQLDRRQLDRLQPTAMPFEQPLKSVICEFLHYRILHHNIVSQAGVRCGELTYNLEEDDHLQHLGSHPSSPDNKAYHVLNRIVRSI